MSSPLAGAPPSAAVSPRGVPAIGAPGRAAQELPAGEPPVVPAVPDHALSEYSTADLEIRAASVRGLMHRYRGQPRQDAFSVSHDQSSDTTIVVVCDGVGSLPRSHEAAAFVVGRLPGHYWTHREWPEAVKAVNAELQEFVEGRPTDLDHAEQHVDGMATTVVAVAVSPSPAGRTASIVRSDDSTAWLLTPDGDWTAVSVDAEGDDAVHTGSVRALPADSPRLHYSEAEFGEGALFVMTDGVGRPLASSAEVRDALANWWSSPPSIFEFASHVGFARKSHMDDRTVVGLWSVSDRSDPA